MLVMLMFNNHSVFKLLLMPCLSSSFLLKLGYALFLYQHLLLKSHKYWMSHISVWIQWWDFHFQLTSIEIISRLQLLLMWSAARFLMVSLLYRKPSGTHVDFSSAFSWYFSFFLDLLTLNLKTYLIWRKDCAGTPAPSLFLKKLI